MWSLDPGTWPRVVNGSPRSAGGKGAAQGVERPWAAGPSLAGGKAQWGQPWGQPALATLARPLAAVLGACWGADAAPHLPAVPAWLRKPRIICEPERAKEGTGKVLIFGGLGTVRDVPLCLAPLVHPGSRMRLGLGVPSLPAAPCLEQGWPRSSLGLPRAISWHGPELSGDEHPPPHPIPPCPTASPFPSYLLPCPHTPTPADTGTTRPGPPG